MGFLTFVVEGWRGQVGEFFSLFLVYCVCGPCFLNCFCFDAFGCHLFLLRFPCWCFCFRCDLSMSFGLFYVSFDQLLVVCSCF